MGHTSDVGRHRAQYIHRLTNEYNGPPVSPPLPIMFIGHLSSINIIGYIRRLRGTDEYIVIFIGTDEEVQISSSELRSSASSSVNRQM
jgi:hypothetical protein